MGRTIKEYVFQKGAVKHVPVNGTFELTSRCNLSCKMCYIHMTEQEQCIKGKELTTAEWTEIGRQAVNQGMLYLLITGGEPLIRPDFCEIYTEMVKMGVMVSINTNGTLLDKEIVDCFCHYRPETVNITLYGMSEETYGNLCGNHKGFEKAINGIRMLKSAGIRVCINTTFTHHNLKDMDALIDFAKDMEIPIRTAAYLFPPVRHAQKNTINDVFLSAEDQGKAGAYFDYKTLESDKLKERQEYIKKIVTEDDENKYEVEKLACDASSCMAGRGAFWVSWDGYMYPCGMLPSYAMNLKETNFQSAWDKMGEYVKEILVSSKCKKCKYKKICPSCAAVAWSENQSTSCVPEVLCRRPDAYMKAFLGYNIK